MLTPNSIMAIRSWQAAERELVQGQQLHGVGVGQPAGILGADFDGADLACLEFDLAERDEPVRQRRRLSPSKQGW